MLQVIRKMNYGPGGGGIDTAGAELFSSKALGLGTVVFCYSGYAFIALHHVFTTSLYGKFLSGWKKNGVQFEINGSNSFRTDNIVM